jgi:hypothetical protein
MLGRYENFPATIHKEAVFTTPLSSKTLQQKLVRIINGINSKTHKLEDIAAPSVPNCSIIFECGIADANDFNYLDKEETSKVLKALRKKPLQTMDFFFAVRYYRTQGEKRNPLRFDYYMIRLVFSMNAMETQVSHERGPRHLTPQDVVNFIVNNVNGTSPKKILKQLE